MIKPDLFDIQRTDKTDLPFFYPYDDSALYQESLLRLPANWPWRNKIIRYDLNSLGYRAPEFGIVNWSEVIICFGCSMTFGIGVNDSDTWPQALSQLTGIPVVNLAVPGGSVQINWANSVRLIAAGVVPRAVIYNWPEVSRSCEFLQGQPVDNWGSWRLDAPQNPHTQNSLGTAWAMNPTHCQTMAELMIQSLGWTCPRLDYTWSESLSRRVKFRYPRVDLARDHQHPGPLSHLAFATMTARDLKNLKI